ncbi:MAG: prepilin-type N-terminal cleavage/methylation domain-containing protein [Gemmataceae bacterium]|nr:prepilin-type N-terminal cleavage/methylation domain-containing protein [Gemmataceae bacterium]
MPRRSGVTLVEVLVAIFIMGIGLIALLTLFPLGILRMAQGIRDARTAESAYNADKIAIMQDVRNDFMVITDGVLPDLFANPGIFDPVSGLPIWTADPYGESYPIFVDPVGWFAAVNSDWVGGPGYQGVLRRRSVQFVENYGIANRDRNIRQFFTLPDEFAFEATTDFMPPFAPPAPPATPQRSGAAVLRSQRGYSWAYLLRRPQTSDRSIVDCTVVVFDRRPMALKTSQSLQEYVYPNMAFFNPDNNTITIEYTSPTVIPPPVRPGDWLLDTTWYATGPTTGSASAFFYRVVASEDFVDTAVVPNRRFTRYEMQNPIRGPAAAPIAPGVGKYPVVVDPLNPLGFVFNGTIVVMDGVAEVYEKGPARLP